MHTFCKLNSGKFTIGYFDPNDSNKWQELLTVADAVTAIRIVNCLNGGDAGHLGHSLTEAVEAYYPKKVEKDDRQFYAAAKQESEKEQLSHTQEIPRRSTHWAGEATHAIDPKQGMGLDLIA